MANQNADLDRKISRVEPEVGEFGRKKTQTEKEKEEQMGAGVDKKTMKKKTQRKWKGKHAVKVWQTKEILLKGKFGTDNM